MSGLPRASKRSEQSAAPPAAPVARRYHRDANSYSAFARGARELPRVSRGSRCGGRAPYDSPGARGVPAVPQARDVVHGSVCQLSGQGDEMRTAALFVVVLLLAGCHEEHAKLKVLQITEKAKARNPNAGLNTEPYLAEVERVEVTDFPGQPPFFVVARTPTVKK